MYELDSARNQTVLVVDDDADILASVSYALEQAGYTVLTASNGEDGLTLAKERKPDLAILDMMMPKRSGFLVIEALREEFTDPIQIIMMTANEGNRHQSYAELLGVADYLHKPVAIDTLLTRVDELLA
ncbi:MAG: two-component system response regulator [Planctomycetaceae bacterium]|nr:two-component system response regulator [Planctomycetaceae bacterium]